MKRIIYFFIFFSIFFSIINVKADQIYNIDESYYYETNDFAIKSYFDEDNVLYMDVINLKNIISCTYEVDFLDSNDKLLYSDTYNFDIFRTGKSFYTPDTNHPQKDLTAKYRIYSSCVDSSDKNQNEYTSSITSDDYKHIRKIIIIIFTANILTFSFIAWLIYFMVKKAKKI